MLEVMVFIEGKRPENPEKNIRSKVTTNSKHETASKPGNPTRVMEVGGERLTTPPTLLPGRGASIVRTFVSGL